MRVQRLPCRVDTSLMDKGWQEGRDRGFTLIELLVVVIVIGVLAAVAVPIYLNHRKKSYVAVVKHDAHTVAVAYQTWAVDNPGQTFPSVRVNWGVNDDDTTPTTMAQMNLPRLSPGVRIHAFDLGLYYPATGWRTGEQFCIETGHTGIRAQDIQFRWNSAKGGITTSGCNVP